MAEEMELNDDDPDVAAALRMEAGDFKFTVTVEREQLDGLRAAAAARRAADDQVVRAVQAARERGASWGLIALMLDVPVAEVRARFGDD